MSAVISVRVADSLFVIDEVAKAHDTDDLAKVVRSRYPKRRVYAYPDASGGNRSTNAPRTDIQILESYGFSNQSGLANPPVRERVSTVQALLENGKGEIRLYVADHCKNLIECLELQSWNEKGEPDKEGGYDHMNDCLGYICYRDFSLLHQRAGKPTGIRIY